MIDIRAIPAVVNLVILCIVSAVSAKAELTGLELSRQIARDATKPTESWPLPSAGPVALDNQTIVYIGEDLRNGGILGVGAGVREAARSIGWKVYFFDIGSRDEFRESVFSEAFSKRPDGIILGGMDGVANAVFLNRFEEAGIPVVGWHVAPFPGPVAGTPIQVNVTTDSLEVARTAAHYVIADSEGEAKVILFTDSRFAIALKKSSTMQEIIGACEKCTVLETLDIELDEVAQQVPQAVEKLLNKYGERWHYSLGINDLYFDYFVTPLVMNGYQPDGAPLSISAGDGSPSAFLRIQNDSYQKATVPEPLLFHGWQLIDELNRLLQKHPPSGYISPPHIVTKDNIWPKHDHLNLFDPENGYRNSYLRSWGKGSKQ
ncbi:substrate-binding domain-containing protein [Desulfosediminicola flagellatus]|uniref:substrate-binding domain-containing protein n=1 Tax=Desulfosediminicola flagellatus TaxID=2569541 RepID=UPI0010ABA521|nr:substrate-binding domain-containing protein [Desulfosediminicola flagellatus]